MPEIKDRLKFEPDSAAKHKWLATRKGPTYLDKITLPGFFRTIEYENDKAWVVFAGCIEGIATILTLYGGFSKGGIYLLGALIAVALFLVFDFVGAKFFHKNKGKKCLIHNRILITSEPGAKVALINSLTKGRIFEILGIVLIILSSILKIISILLLGKFNIIFYAILSLFYLIVIYIHLSHTGYFLAEMETESTFKEQHGIWAKSMLMVQDDNMDIDSIKFAASKISSTLMLEIKLDIDDNIPISVGEHSISFCDKTEKEGRIYYKYVIETMGVLTDEDIVSFTNKQGGDQAQTIAFNCLKHQIEKILNK